MSSQLSHPTSTLTYTLSITQSSRYLKISQIKKRHVLDTSLRVKQFRTPYWVNVQNE